MNAFGRDIALFTAYIVAVKPYKSGFCTVTAIMAREADHRDGSDRGS